MIQDRFYMPSELFYTEKLDECFDNLKGAWYILLSLRNSSISAYSVDTDQTTLIARVPIWNHRCTINSSYLIAHIWWALL